MRHERECEESFIVLTDYKNLGDGVTLQINHPLLGTIGEAILSEKDIHWLLDKLRYPSYKEKRKKKCRE